MAEPTWPDWAWKVDMPSEDELASRWGQFDGGEAGNAAGIALLQYFADGGTWDQLQLVVFDILESMNGPIPLYGNPGFAQDKFRVGLLIGIFSTIGQHLRMTASFCPRTHHSELELRARIADALGGGPSRAVEARLAAERSRSAKNAADARWARVRAEKAIASASLSASKAAELPTIAAP